MDWFLHDNGLRHGRADIMFDKFEMVLRSSFSFTN